MFDLNIGSEFNHCQTFYLDGIYTDKKYDYYLTNYIGVNVKLGSSEVKQQIEWLNVIPRERKENYIQPTEPVVAKNTSNTILTIKKAIQQNLKARKEIDKKTWINVAK
jgi:hypothetical protein